MCHEIGAKILSNAALCTVTAAEMSSHHYLESKDRKGGMGVLKIHHFNAFLCVWLNYSVCIEYYARLSGWPASTGCDILTGLKPWVPVMRRSTDCWGIRDVFQTAPGFKRRHWLGVMHLSSLNLLWNIAETFLFLTGLPSFHLPHSWHLQDGKKWQQFHLAVHLSPLMITTEVSSLSDFTLSFHFIYTKQHWR